MRPRTFVRTRFECAKGKGLLFLTTPWFYLHFFWGKTK